MKTKFSAPLGWGIRALVGTAMCLFIALAQRSGAAPFDMPTGGWDCLTSGGGQRGITLLIFSNTTDSNGLFTFSGFTAVDGTRSVNENGFGGRNPGGGVGRSGSPGSTNTVENLFGGETINGEWFFDAQGRIVGSFFDVVNATALQTNFMQTCASTDIVFTVVSTNGAPSYSQTENFSVCFSNGPIFQTNFLTFITSTNDGNLNVFPVSLAFANTNFTIVPIGSTNAVSFVGTVVPGKRLTLNASTPLGKVSYNGIPLQPIALKSGLSLDGSAWIGTKKTQGVSELESFTLTATGIPNLFLMNGQGPTYTYNNPADPTEQSLCLISRQGRIAFLVIEIPFGTTEGNLRITMGSFINSRKNTAAQTRGVEAPNLSTPVIFNATLLPDGPLGP